MEFWEKNSEIRDRAVFSILLEEEMVVMEVTGPKSSQRRRAKMIMWLPGLWGQKFIFFIALNVLNH